MYAKLDIHTRAELGARMGEGIAPGQIGVVASFIDRPRGGPCHVDGPPRRRPPESRTFLVERYWPDIDEAQARALAASLEQAAEAMAAEGIAGRARRLDPHAPRRVVFSLITATR